MNKRLVVFILLCCVLVVCSFSYKDKNNSAYLNLYETEVVDFNNSQKKFRQLVFDVDAITEQNKAQIKSQLSECRTSLKKVDIWLRYFDPIIYKHINGPLPVEWETEVFEKHEAPYKRLGYGLTLAELYLDEENISKDSLLKLIDPAIKAATLFTGDSIYKLLQNPDNFYFANRLYLLNLATIYTTGFECPDTSRIIPELLFMMKNVSSIYKSYNESYVDLQWSNAYLLLYENAINFVASQPQNFSDFNTYEFIRDYINPLFAQNQNAITRHNLVSTSSNDYSINEQCNTIFSKNLFVAQNTKGIYYGITDEQLLSEIFETGKLLFYDPLVSGNVKRSCASCHKSGQLFTDTTRITAQQFDSSKVLARNTPSLVNVTHNHLLMLDGKHIVLENQARDVVSNPIEMGSSEALTVAQIMNCNDYKTAFKKYAKYTPAYPKPSFEHIASALIVYYSSFSKYDSDFDNAMNKKTVLNNDAVKGFNLFMSKAQCGTCHFVPQFSGVKPPYISSEFEVLGTPQDSLYSKLSPDSGRYLINPANETLHAFRTGTLRNAARTKPYMHNGVFTSLDQVLEFYNGGGGAGRGLQVENQTLSGDSLHLSDTEKKQLIAFIATLNEDVIIETVPKKLPQAKNKKYNLRIPEGEY